MNAAAIRESSDHPHPGEERSMEKTPVFRRRHYFIKKEYQTRFILRFCLIALAGVALSTVLLLFFSQGTLTSSYHNSRLVVQSTTFAIMPAVLYTNLVTLLLILLATVVTVLFLSHKIAGPMLRFEKELQIVAGGDLTQQIRLREKDQFTELAQTLNAMTGSLRQRVASTHQELDRALALARAGSGVPAELLASLENLSTALTQRFNV